ncbi:MAG TPA: IclR family transcriptional regulator [Burkholderiaceae bacterium]|nr:IclR family transcriptional regulator [Burkholderiaceae bacterium]
MTSAAKPRPARESDSRGIQSIEVGGRLLLALAHHGQPLALKDLAAAADMTAGKAHPYLVSFIKLGLVERETEGGRYGLGPLALQMGLIGLQQYDPVRLATDCIDELARATGHTVAIAVWGHRGPTLVRIAEAPSPVHVSMRHGTVMSIPDTASGRLFAAFGPAQAVREALDNEARLAPAGAAARHARARTGGRFGLGAAFDREIARVRADGVAGIEGVALPGLSALAAPVFDARGQLVLSLTAIGPSATFDASVDGAVARALKPAALQLSTRLGWKPPAPGR